MAENSLNIIYKEEISLNYEQIIIGNIENWETKKLFEPCGYLDEKDKPYVLINYEIIEKKMCFDFVCSPELMLQVAIFARFAYQSKTVEQFINSNELKLRTFNLLKAIMPYPTNIEYNKVFYDSVKKFYSDNFNFDFGYCDGLGDFLEHLLYYINIMHPMHQENLKTFLNGFVQLYNERLDLLCSKLNIKNIFESTDFTNGTIDIPLLKPLIKDDFILDGLRIKFYPDMNINNEIGYEISGRLNGKTTKLSIRGVAFDYTDFIKLIKVMQTNIMESPNDFLNN